MGARKPGRLTGTRSSQRNILTILQVRHRCQKTPLATKRHGYTFISKRRRPLTILSIPFVTRGAFLRVETSFWETCTAPAASKSSGGYLSVSQIATGVARETRLRMTRGKLSL